MPEFPIDDETDAEPHPEPPPRRYSRWQYLLLAGIVCVLIVIFFPFLVLASTLGVFLLMTGTLAAFLYWLLFSRSGFVRRWVRYRNLQARRRNRLLRRAAERGLERGEGYKTDG